MVVAGGQENAGLAAGQNILDLIKAENRLAGAPRQTQRIKRPLFKRRFEGVDQTLRSARLLLEGAGEKAFVAGADITEMLGLSAEQALDFSMAGMHVMHALEALPVPVIALVNCATSALAYLPRNVTVYGPAAAPVTDTLPAPRTASRAA